MPSYGGSLFDPSRFAFLTARGDRATLAITVSDRVMVEVLRAVQIAQLRGQPARRISFRDIDVEQIGYIYEGLLGYTCAQVDEITIGLIGKPGEEPEIPLARLEFDALILFTLRVSADHDAPTTTPWSRSSSSPRAVAVAGRGRCRPAGSASVATPATAPGVSVSSSAADAPSPTGRT